MTETSSAIPATPTAELYQAEGDKNLDWVSAQDPIALFETWLAEAGKTESNDPNAMSLATVDGEGLPDVRIVLLKGLDEKGFVFYSNAQSAKGVQLTQEKAALCFHWKSQKRQVRVRGDIEQVSGAEADAYFASRARGSRIGAWASDQSRPVADRETMMARVADVEDRFKDKTVPRPPHWKGWRVKPRSIEFWQDGAFRLHDRIVFMASDNGWTTQRVFP
jgi:pyridoxamine 5'-phosphate oxidase